MIKTLYCCLAVYVGYWDGCPVAVKCLYDDLADVERYIQLVQEEASVAWKIHHPNIAVVCGVMHSGERSQEGMGYHEVTEQLRF